ncbi:MAG: (4Fe-4S)-binding protein [Piscirickettsiaceae bacterium]|nr:(4Fe-4S)-binding protein [Piscirickettsiaceae bacterium]
MKVNWDENVCQHAGVCVTNYSSLYKVEDGKFVISTENATDEQIKESIAKCPSGALTSED